MNGAVDAAIGPEALFNNENGHSNTAIGSEALFKNQTGSRELQHVALVHYILTRQIGIQLLGIILFIKTLRVKIILQLVMKYFIQIQLDIETQPMDIILFIMTPQDITTQPMDIVLFS